MRLLALVDSPEHVCCRYRLAAYGSRLDRAGHGLELRPFPRRSWQWPGMLRAVRKVDLVILQRRLLHPALLFLLRRASRRLVFDVDDAVFLRDSYDSRGFHSARRLRRFVSIVRAADAVVAGNAYLSKEACSWTSAAKVQIIPTCIDPERYSLAEPAPAEPSRRRGPVELAWIGSSSTLQGMEAMRPMLEDIGRRCPGLCLKLICDRFFSLRHLPVSYCLWSEAGEAAALTTADIGISWVPDDPWSLGKCGLKVLQYMAAGLPVVANAVGVQAEIVQHGETGFLANTPSQWVETLGRLAGDAALRRQMGLKGRQFVEKKFSVEVGACGWLELLEQLSRQKAAA